MRKLLNCENNGSADAETHPKVLPRVDLQVYVLAASVFQGGEVPPSFPFIY
jgi:hypothetical protein